MRLAGRSAIVTGAGGGMGLATAQRLAEDGARVLAVDLPSKLGRNKDRIRFLGADLRQPTALQAIITAATDAFGGIDILVNNAGVIGDLEPDPFGTEENWRFVMAVNLDAVWGLCRLASEALKASGAGRIINIGSVNSEYPSTEGVAAYVASKHAVYGLTKNLAMTLGRYGITANAILPGATDTPMTRAYPDYEAFEAMGAGRSPLGRMGTPQDIANVVAFLASDDASFVTGIGLYVDGGIHLNV
jgi:3-oxoacyl-[acyl-carrier protein] reductase